MLANFDTVDGFTFKNTLQQAINLNARSVRIDRVENRHIIDLVCFPTGELHEGLIPLINRACPVTGKAADGHSGEQSLEAFGSHL